MRVCKRGKHRKKSIQVIHIIELQDMSVNGWYVVDGGSRLQAVASSHLHDIAHHIARGLRSYVVGCCDNHETRLGCYGMGPADGGTIEAGYLVIVGIFTCKSIHSPLLKSQYHL